MKELSKETYDLYNYKPNKGDKIRFLPSLNKIQDSLKYRTYNVPKDIYVVDYPDIIGDTLRKYGVDYEKKRFASTTIFVKDKTPQEERNESREAMKKKLAKIRNS